MILTNDKWSFYLRREWLVPLIRGQCVLEVTDILSIEGLIFQATKGSAPGFLTSYTFRSIVVPICNMA